MAVLLHRVRLHSWSLPSRERGLKFIGSEQFDPELVSLPPRERGLKLNFDRITKRVTMSLPPRERGLK